MAKAAPDTNPGAMSSQARAGLTVTFGLDGGDPLILAAALAGSFYVQYLAHELADTLTPEELGAVELISMQAMNHWRGALTDIGAIPTPEHWRTDNGSTQEG